MIRLKNYDGLLNLDKFSRIEKNEDEQYEFRYKNKKGNGCEPVKVYSIRFFTAEGYAGLSSSIDYGTNKQARDEDYQIIFDYVCENKNNNFDIINEQENINSYLNDLREHAEELKELVQTTRNQLDKAKKKK